MYRSTSGHVRRAITLLTLSLTAGYPAYPDSPRFSNVESAPAGCTMTNCQLRAHPPGDATPRGIELPCRDDAARLDVLFTYTAAARTQAGGTAAITAIAQNAITMANQTLADSGVLDVTFQMVDIREITYDEFAGNPDGVTHLQRFSGVGDGFMDSVHAWRNETRADLASLIVASGGNFAGGVGWANVNDPASGFTVCERQATIDGTFSHEWGHNLGLFHQCSNFPGDYLRYAQGYLWNNSQNGQSWATAMVGFSATCPRLPTTIYIPRYSNPDLTYQGEPIGIPLSQPNATHEALAIRETHFAVANFRRSNRIADCNGNGIDDQIDIAVGTSVDMNSNGRPDECEKRLYVNAAVTTPGDGSSWSAARRDLAEAMRVAALPCSNVREIWVAQGTYKPDAGTNRRDLSFSLGASVQVFGGFSGNETSLSQRDFVNRVTTLSGDIGIAADPADNSYSVVTGYDCGSGALLDGFTIRYGNAWGDGGGIYLEDSFATIRNCVLTGNAAAFGGGAAACDGGRPRFEDCVFSGNEAGYGGGVKLYQTIAASLLRCEFVDNTGDFASALSIDASTNVQVTECDFVHNVSDVFTGAIDQGNSSATYTTCLFDLNDATTDGGGLTLTNNSTGTLSGCTFLRNHAGRWGGALAVYGDATAAILNSHFELNLSPDLGGAATVAGTAAQFRGCTFLDNVSGSGGALSVYSDAEALLDDCVFEGNHALFNGGGIEVRLNSSLYAARSRFLGNTAVFDGGGIFANDALPMTVVNCEFSGGTAQTYGGGGVSMYLRGNHLISSSTFATNSSVSDGGAAYAWASSFTMHNCIGWADSPTEIGLYAGATATITYCNLQGGFGGAGNTAADPLFVNRLGVDGVAGTSDDNLKLQGSSPCIDAGNTTALPPDAADSDGDGNVTEPTPFDLRGEMRLFDVAARPNTGNGSPPIDKGAYEMQPPACPGDLDNDGSVGLSDLARLLSNFGRLSGATAADGDTDGDQDVDLSDLAFLLSRFGTVCG